MHRGITLIELLVTLAVAAVLLHAALPAFADLLASQRAAAASNAVVGAVQLARSSAITHRTAVTFCPRSGNACGGRAHWRDGGLVFLDHNRNAELDAGEPLLGTLAALEAGATLAWRSFRNRSYLRFEPRGYTDWQNGHFQYCPASSDARHARQVIINAQGRTRSARDRDGDGIREDARGRPLRCP